MLFVDLGRRHTSVKTTYKTFAVKIVSKFDLGLLKAYNPMHFDRNISENKDGKKMRAVRITKS